MEFREFYKVASFLKNFQEVLGILEIYFVTENSWELFRTGKKGAFTTSFQVFQHFGTIVH